MPLDLNRFERLDELKYRCKRCSKTLKSHRKGEKEYFTNLSKHQCSDESTAKNATAMRELEVGLLLDHPEAYELICSAKFKDFCNAINKSRKPFVPDASTGIAEQVQKTEQAVRMALQNMTYGSICLVKQHFKTSQVLIVSVSFIDQSFREKEATLRVQMTNGAVNYGDLLKKVIEDYELDTSRIVALSTNIQALASNPPAELPAGTLDLCFIRRSIESNLKSNLSSNVELRRELDAIWDGIRNPIRTQTAIRMFVEKHPEIRQQLKKCKKSHSIF